MVMKGVSKTTAVSLGALLFMAVGSYYVASSVLPNVLVTMTKAAPAVKVSIGGSYLLGDKMVAVADGKDKAKVNVFVLDNSGKPVSKKLVSLAGIETISPVGNGFSDNQGKVSFEMTSTVEGVFPLEASVEGVPLPRKVSVTFRK